MSNLPKAPGYLLGVLQGAVGDDFLLKQQIISAGVAGDSSGWLPIAPYGERFAYALDSGSTNTTFSIDVSADGTNSLAQAFTGSYSSSSVAEITPPILFSNPQAKFFRITVLSGGPISFLRGV